MTQERPREDVFRELELILEAKKNINSIITTMYSVFYSLEGLLLYSFYVIGTVPARVSVAFFGALCLVGLLLVTLRTKGTNDRCDRRAKELEEPHGIRVILNYDNSSEHRRPRFIFRATMHGTLMAVDALLFSMWIVLAVLAALDLV